MDLAGALGLADRELVAFVGAGGKKTAMARLVEVAATRGRSVGYTTTTHVPPPDLPLVVAAPEALDAALDASRPPVAFASAEVDQPERADRKLRGFEPAVVDRVHRAGRFDWLLVKADGARRRAFKAPGPDEPALPEATTHLVAVASVGVVGAPLDEAQVHRPQRVASITGLELGETIGAAAVGTVLASPAGGLKGVPEGARVTFLVNQADTESEAETARTVLEHAFDRADRPASGIVSSFRTGRCDAVEPGGP